MEPPRPHALRAPRGFTLVEMVVVVAIIGVISAVTVVSHGSFDRSLGLTDVAYTVAFSVREAQALGLSSRVFSGATYAGYGVQFSRATPTEYRLYADTHPAAPGTNAPYCPGHAAPSGPEARPGDCVQTQPGEIAKAYKLNNRFSIQGFCGMPAGGGQLICSDSGSPQMDTLDVVFMRPNTQSVITGRVNGTYTQLSDAILRIVPPDGSSKRCVRVSKTGEVSVLIPGESGCPA